MDQPPPGKETIAKGGSSRPFDHSLEPAARDEFAVEVDTFLHERAEDPRILPVGPQSLGHAILLDQPERDRVSAPYGFLRETADQDAARRLGSARTRSRNSWRALSNKTTFSGTVMGSGHSSSFRGFGNFVNRLRDGG
jgi:hypothetical protein